MIQVSHLPTPSIFSAGTIGTLSGFMYLVFQGCKIPHARSHLRVKCYAGRVKVFTICVVLL